MLSWDRAGDATFSGALTPRLPEDFRPAAPGPRLDGLDELRVAAAMGLTLRFGREGETRSLLLRERRLLGEGFSLSARKAGAADASRDDRNLRIWTGWSVSPDRERVQAALAVFGQGLAVHVLERDGSVLEVVSGDGGEQWEVSRSRDGGGWSCDCSGEGGLATVRGTIQREPLEAGALEPLWLARAGEDPATGELDRYVEPVRRGEAYELSLRDVLLLMVLDQGESGPDNDENLESLVSRRLATVANVAAVYEQQLGLRILLQELIVIPGEPGYNDVPSEDEVDDFRLWLSENRRQSAYGWDVALKWGKGLEAGTLGKAFVGTVASASGVGVLATGTGWATCAHEMGHVLGSQHSRGGIMNATAVSDANQDFFTDVTEGETAAKDIYDRSAGRLRDGEGLRHPEEIPFAVNDVVVTNDAEPIVFDPLENDRRSVRNGIFNPGLSVEETSSVLPPGAGTAEPTGEGVIFRPAEGFSGTAWFSYTLRGSVGNNGRGWLHKGDVAVEVGLAQSDPRLLRLAPGQSYSFVAERSGPVQRQPAMARVDVSLDDPQLLVLRVSEDAEGEDAFSAAGADYRIIYEEGTLVLRPDAYVFSPGLGRLEMHPLANDDGVGSGWLTDSQVSLGVGTPGAGAVREYFPLALALTGSQLDDPSLGSLEVETRPIRVGDDTAAVPTGRLFFELAAGASGEVEITYWARDAAGKTGSGRIRVYVDGEPESWIELGHTVRYHVPENGLLDDRWKELDFDDAAWPAGASGAGYDFRGAYDPWIGVDVREVLYSQRSSIYLRFPFQVQLPARLTGMILRMRFDDGFVAYLNGREVARRNAPPAPGWQSFATAAVEASGTEAEVLDLGALLPLLREGHNVLAIHGLNQRAFSSDFLIQPELQGIVGDRLASIAAPVVRAVSLEPGTSLLLEGQWKPSGTLSREGNRQMRWIVAESESQAAVELEWSGNGTAVFRDPPEGLTRLRLIASWGAIETTADVIVQVGEPFLFPEIGARVDAGPDQEVDDPTAILSGAVEPIGIEPFLGTNWRQVDGPVSAEILTPHLLETQVRFSMAGLYRFRLVADTTSARTLDDVLVQVNPQVIPAPELGVFSLEEAGEREAALAIEVRSVGGSAAGLTVFWGRQDAGASPEGWEGQFDPASVTAPGRIPLTLEGLQPGSAYFVRVRMEGEQATVWSPALSFSTVEKPKDAYLEWAQRFFENVNAEEAGPQADADGDGRVNFEEFSLGTQPRERDLAVSRLELREGGAFFVYRRSREAVEAGVLFEVQVSGAVVNAWNPAGPGLVTHADAEFEAVEAGLGEAAGARLVRLRIIGPTNGAPE
ncbi:MAG TPA: zinc-dependent metalloprotease family protein [Verrucomicrobiales bacterium]|nr:zinc-dependent metalloprotease family protein [Verrucomicrobiales bacterium]